MVDFKKREKNLRKVFLYLIRQISMAWLLSRIDLKRNSSITKQQFLSKACKNLEYFQSTLNNFEQLTRHKTTNF